MSRTAWRKTRFCAAATASPTTADRTRRSRGSSSGSPRRLKQKRLPRRPTGPLTLAEALLSSPSSVTTNNWGVDKDYALGTIHTWNAAVTRDLHEELDGHGRLHRDERDEPRHPARAEPWPVRGADCRACSPSRGSPLAATPCSTPEPSRCGGVLPAVFAAASPTRSRAPGTTPRRSAPARGSSRRTTRTSNRSGRCPASIAGIRCRATSRIELPWGPNRRWLKNGGRPRRPLRRMVGDAGHDASIGHAAHRTRSWRRRSDVSRGTNGSLRGQLYRRAHRVEQSDGR